MPEDTPNPNLNRHRGRPFAKGQGGRPLGARNKATLAVECLLAGEAETLTRKAVDVALTGDVGALRLCLERLAPPRRDRAVSVALPAIEAVSDLPRVSAAIIAATAAGQITPAEGEQLGRLVASHATALQTCEFEARLRALEAEKESQP